MALENSQLIRCSAAFQTPRSCCANTGGNLEATAEVFRDGWYRSGKEFRFLDALPRNTMGKGLRYELRKLALESADS